MTDYGACRITGPINLASGSLSQPVYSTDFGRFLVIRLLIALLLPWLSFFFIGRPVQGIICIVLQLTLIGWIPAAIWAVYALSQYDTDRKIAGAQNKL